MSSILARRRQKLLALKALRGAPAALADGRQESYSTKLKPPRAAAPRGTGYRPTS